MYKFLFIAITLFSAHSFADNTQTLQQALGELNAAQTKIYEAQERIDNARGAINKAIQENAVQPAAWTCIYNGQTTALKGTSGSGASKEEAKNEVHGKCVSQGFPGETCFLVKQNASCFNNF